MSYVKYNIGVFCQEYEPENEWCKSAKKTPAVDSEEGMRLLPPPVFWLASALSSSQLRTAQPQSVADYRHRTETHRRRRNHRAQHQTEERIEHSGRDGNAHCVVDECEEKILANVTHGGAAEQTSPHNAAKIAFHQCDPGAFDGHVGAGSHGDADVSLGQSGRVIDSVPGHGHKPSLRLNFFDPARLVLRQNVCKYVINTQLSSNGNRGGIAV